MLIDEPELPEALRGDADTIVAAFQQARERRAFESPRLRAVVEAFTVTAFRLELPPERILVLLKGVVRNRALDGVNAWFRTVMTERASAWAIDAYFRVSDDSGHEPPPHGAGGGGGGAPR